jgi:hypothetical protein
MVVPQKRADHHIFEDGHVLEGDRHLKSSSNSGLCVRLRRGAGDIGAVEQHAPCARYHVAGKTVEEG